jgi:hypothetical protein
MAADLHYDKFVRDRCRIRAAKPTTLRIGRHEDENSVLTRSD